MHLFGMIISQIRIELSVPHFGELKYAIYFSVGEMVWAVEPQ